VFPVVTSDILVFLAFMLSADEVRKERSLFTGKIETASGDFSIPCAGFMIEKGAITYPVQGAGINGNLLGLLKSIDTVADDLTWIYNFGDLNYGSPTSSVSGIKISSSGEKERS
jgi:predicted Zn-dependent protease